MKTILTLAALAAFTAPAAAQQMTCWDYGGGQTRCTQQSMPQVWRPPQNPGAYAESYNALRGVQQGMQTQQQLQMLQQQREVQRLRREVEALRRQ